MSPEPNGVSELLREWARGDARAGEDLVPLVYRELRRRAGAYLRNERRDHTLQPRRSSTMLRAVVVDRVTCKSRSVFRVAAQ